VKLVTILILVLFLFNIAVVSANSPLDILGTNAALGSPILNRNFLVEDWNRWEMVVWGIFLSNFTIPLIDDYNSAFNRDATFGSRGSGFRALVFGSGTDPANRETINNLLHYAVVQQTSGPLEAIYVNHRNINAAGVEDFDGDIFEGRRRATFKDLFLMENEEQGESWVRLTPQQGGALNFLVNVDTTENYKYKDIVTIQNGRLPTFFVEHGAGLEVIFDYTNNWDMQVLTAWISRGLVGDHADEFRTTLQEMWDTELGLYLDSFGNIVTNFNGSRRIVIPASVNQHLTYTPKINLLSSLIFNGINSNFTSREMVLRGQQNVVDSWWDGFIGSEVDVGGVPALGSEQPGTPQGEIIMFFDLDTIMHSAALHGGENSTGVQRATASSIFTMEGDLAVAKNLYYTNYTSALRELFSLDITRRTGNNYPFKIEATNMQHLNFGDGYAGDALERMVHTAGLVVNIVGGGDDAQILSELITNDGRINIFSDPVLIPVQQPIGLDGNEVNFHGVGRKFLNYVYSAYKYGKVTTAGTVDRDLVHDIFRKNNAERSMLDFRNNVFWGLGGSVTITPLIAGFIADNSGQQELFNIHVDPSELVGQGDGGWTFVPFTVLNDYQINGVNAISSNFDIPFGMESFGAYPGRVIKAYPISEVMRAVGNVLGVREGTEFGVYSTFIYMTYLDWYGVNINNLTGEARSDLNPKIFDGDNDVVNVDINTIIDARSEEDIQAEIINLTYKMLHPTEGEAYRTEMMRSYLNSFVYDTYNRVVFGSASTFYSSLSENLATRSTAGFLHFPAFSENFMTAWFIDAYIRIVLYLIAAMFVLTILIGILKGRKVSWYIITLAVIINSLILVPSVGEVLPLVVNNFIEDTFDDKMSYWSIYESVSNAKMEREFVENNEAGTGFLGGLGREQREEAIRLIRALNVVYLDRSLMIRQDISRKVTQTQTGNFAEIQRMRSTRWILPMILRQFTASDESANYVYIPLSDKFADISNMYWFYNPSDAVFSDTVAGTADTEEEITIGSPLTIEQRQEYFINHIDTNSITLADTVPYRFIGSEINEEIDMPHRFFYLIRDNNLTISRNYESEDMWADITSRAIEEGLRYGFISTVQRIERSAGGYDRFDRSTVSGDFGFLWATETVMPYFYQVVKSSFERDSSLGALSGYLQGTFIGEEGSEVRRSFMHAGETGLVRDILDLEELFTNKIPYLFTIQQIAGGSDGETGVLGSDMIEDYDIYTGNLRSWLFRSNWVTKIMGNETFSRPMTVRDRLGTLHEIKNPLLASSYPSERPMIFSEAQQAAYGLHDADLNIIELKAIEINNAVARRWTLLLNYINLPGMSKEVMLRHMALEATLQFNETMSPEGIFNAAYRLYPTTINLRAISFDSVMRMLMLNITRNTSYIYGNTMQNVIRDTDIFSAILLLIAAFLGAYIIPLVRDVAAGMLFFLGFAAVIYAIIKGGKKDMSLLGGYVGSVAIFATITIIYYSMFTLLLSITTPDEVITLQRTQVSIGNPVWMFIIIIITGSIYTYALYKLINFCFKNYRDMGASVYKDTIGRAIDSVSNGAGKLMDKANDNIVNDTYKKEGSKGKANNGGDGESAVENTVDDVTDKEKTKDDTEINYYSNEEDQEDIDSKIDKDLIEHEIYKGKELTEEEREEWKKNNG